MTLPLECDLNVEVSKLAERSSAGYPKSKQPVSRWYAAYTCPRHEKYVARQLDERCIDTFVPLYRSLRRWKDRRTQIELPLFPGYVFVHFDLEQRLRILELPGVVRLGEFQWPTGDATGIRDRDVTKRFGPADLRRTSSLFARGPKGTRVAWAHGCTEGILVRKKDKFRLVISLEAIMRSTAVEVDAADVQPA